MALREGDYMKQITDFIRNRMDGGYKDYELRILLINQGYSRSAIERGFRLVEQDKSRNQVEQKAPPKVVIIDSAQKREEPKKGFFTKLFGIFKTEDKPEPQQEMINIDANGNLVRN